MPSIADHVQALRADVAAACARAGRAPATVRIIAVTKSQGREVLAPLAAAGLTEFGENRIEHLLQMHQAAPPGTRFHAIGRLQSRQLRALVGICASVHSLCDPSHLQKLSALCQEAGTRIEVFLQVNTSGETTKAGVTPAALPAVLAQARLLPGLEVVGLMTMAPEMPDHQTDDGRIRQCFRALATLGSALDLPRLSMGMSQDFPIAVEEGATDIRVGTRLFA